MIYNKLHNYALSIKLSFFIEPQAILNKKAAMKINS